MNIFDIGIILIFIMFILSGFKKGVIKESVSFVGIIIVFILSFSLKGALGNLLCTFLPFFKFSHPIEGITSINILMYQIIAFMIVFSILLGLYTVALKISKILQKLVNFTVILLLPSKILGGLVSFLKGYIILFVILLVLIIPLQKQPIYTESKLVNSILYKTPIISNSTKSFTKSIEEIYDLGYKVSKNEISSNTANLLTLEIMLKYNIVTKDTIKNLISLNKLDNIENIENVLSKY